MIHAPDESTQLAAIGRLMLKAQQDRDEAAELRKRIDRAISIMVCIGGPLNDNVLQFNKEQRAVFHRIQSVLEGSSHG